MNGVAPNAVYTYFPDKAAILDVVIDRLTIWEAAAHPSALKVLFIGAAIVLLHDYHFYLVAQHVRERCPDAVISHFVHIPWTQPDAWRVLPTHVRDELYRGILANDIVGFHTRSYRWNFLQCCRDLMDYEVDFERGVVQLQDREVWVRHYPLPIDYKATRKVAAMPWPVEVYHSPSGSTPAAAQPASSAAVRALVCWSAEGPVTLAIRRWPRKS